MRPVNLSRFDSEGAWTNWGAVPCALWGNRPRNREKQSCTFLLLHFASISCSGTSLSPGSSDDTPLDVKSFVIAMAPKFKDGDVVFAFSGKWVSWVHTVAAYGQYRMIEQRVSLLTDPQLLSSAH